MAGGHPNVYLYCANDLVNGTDSDGMAEDPGGPKGSIRIVIAQFIKDPEVEAPRNRWFAGDDRGFSPNNGSCRLQNQLIITRGANGQPHVEQTVMVGETHITQGKNVGWKDKAKPSIRKPLYIQRKDGGYDVIVSVAAANPFYRYSPNIGSRVTLSFDRAGNLHSILGTHTKYPACEVYAYSGEKGMRGYKVLPLHTILSR